MERKGAGVLAEHDTELRKSLLCGFGIIEQVINAKEYEDTKRSLVLPVSTKSCWVIYCSHSEQGS